MGSMAKNKKTRVELRRNRTKPPRVNDVTRHFGGDPAQSDQSTSGRRVRSEGMISRHRTIMVGHNAGHAVGEQRKRAQAASSRFMDSFLTWRLKAARFCAARCGGF